MKQVPSIGWVLAIVTLLTLVIVFPGAGFFSDAQAATASGSPGLDASCSQMQTYGFTAGLVYCVQSSLDKAVTQYVAAMQSNLRFYEGMAAMLAIALFGFKLMNSNVQEPLKETITVVMRLLIGVFFFENAVNLYHWVVGTVPGAPQPFSGIINEAIGWVTGTGNGSSGGSGGNMFGNLVSANCSADDPPQQFEGYQVWQAFDCMFREILGAADPGKHPYAFSTSLLAIIAASIFSATMGVIVAGLGLTLFVSALFAVFRSLYLVLMAYVCVGFMTLFAPLIAPMLFFDSQYLTEKFLRWVGVIISCIFQPVLVIAFLAMLIVVDDQIIEGNFPSPGCTLPTYPSYASGSTNSGAPVGGWGQDGSGVCSFTQLFNQGQSGQSLQVIFHNMLDNNRTIFNQSAISDTQATCTNSNTTGTLCFNPQTAVASGNTGVVPLAEQLQEFAGSINWNGATALKRYAPMRQLMLTLLTFIFVNFAMVKLLEVIPEMAKNMTTYVGVSLARGLQVPFESQINKLIGSAQGKAQQYAQGKGLLPQLFGAGSKSSTKANPGSLPGQTGGTVKR
jgi:hypothetical protein